MNNTYVVIIMKMCIISANTVKSRTRKMKRRGDSERRNRII